MVRLPRRDTISLLREEMARLLAAATALDDERRGKPIYSDWTGKDILAHVAAWDGELLRAVDEVLAGHRAPFAGYREADFNVAAVEERRTASFEDVLSETRNAHEALMHRLEALTDDDWIRESPHRWGDWTPMTVGSLFDYRYRGLTHYGGHAVEIETWAARQKPPG